MSVAVVVLNWSEAKDDSGIKLYNVYRDNALHTQLNELTYQFYNEEKPKTIKYQVVALTNSGEFLKSNEISITTLDVDGFYALNYTLNFDL